MNVEQLSSLVDASIILHSRIYQYLILYRTHCNGLNDVFIPKEPFVVTINKCPTRNKIALVLNYTVVSHHQVTQYLSPDDDDFSEAWGSDNSCGYTTETESVRKDYHVNIDMKCLLLPQEDLIRRFKEDAIEDKRRKAEQVRLQTIRELEEKLAKLKEPEHQKN